MDEMHGHEQRCFTLSSFLYDGSLRFFPDRQCFLNFACTAKAFFGMTDDDKPDTHFFARQMVEILLRDASLADGASLRALLRISRTITIPQITQ
jgi:hypothetical protein